MSDTSPLQSKVPPDTYGDGKATAYGRPLSIIESITSGTDDEEQSDTSVLGNDGASPLTNLSPEEIQDLRMEIDELLKIGQIEPESSGSPSMQTYGDNRSVHLRDLTRLLGEFEKVKGRALLNEEARPVLDQYVEENPDLPLTAESLLLMIAALNASRDEQQRKDGEAQSEEERGHWRSEALNGQRTASGASDYGTDLSGTGDEESASDDQLHETPLQTVSRPHYDFPRSQSERGNLSGEGQGTEGSHDSAYVISTSRRKPTISDPQAPLMQSRRVSSSATRVGNSDGKNRDRKQSGEAFDKDVLRGKGKAKIPPSSWSNNRPKPQAFAKRDRNRRVSDISSGYSEYADHEEPGSSSPLPRSASIQSQ